jgi:hypothetical protein
MKSMVSRLLALGWIIMLFGCSGGSTPSNDRLEQAFAQGRSGVWISGHGTVVRELGGTSAEQRFQVRIGDELTIVLRRDIQAASRINVQPEDRLAFHGRYDFHGGGGTVSLTHPDPSQPGGGGWIEVNGVRQD